MSQITTIQLVIDLKRMGRMQCTGCCARVIDMLCDAIEIELQARVAAAIMEVGV